eukprot:666964-Hanusia_phi.AAC.1
MQQPPNANSTIYEFVSASTGTALRHAGPGGVAWQTAAAVTLGRPGRAESVPAAALGQESRSWVRAF